MDNRKKLACELFDIIDAMLTFNATIEEVAYDVEPNESFKKKKAYKVTNTKTLKEYVFYFKINNTGMFKGIFQDNNIWHSRVVLPSLQMREHFIKQFDIITTQKLNGGLFTINFICMAEMFLKELLFVDFK